MSFKELSGRSSSLILCDDGNTSSKEGRIMRKLGENQFLYLSENEDEDLVKAKI